MSTYILFLVLTAAVLHATWNLLAKRASGKVPFIWLQYVVGTILSLPILCYLYYSGRLHFSMTLLYFAAGSAILHLLYFIILQKGYRTADLSVVYPLARGSGPLFASLGALLFLHEIFKISTTVGLFLIIAGVLIITGLSIKREISPRMWAGIQYGVLTGLFIALYTINDSLAVKQFAVDPLVLTLLTSMFSMAFLLPFVVHQGTAIRREIKEQKRYIVSIAILSNMAYVLVLIALKNAPLTVVAPARETSILLGVFIGSKVLNETDGRRRLIAGLLILAGIVALSLS